MFKINYGSKQRTDVTKAVTKITVLILLSSPSMFQCHQNNSGGERKKSVAMKKGVNPNISLM